MPDYHRPKNSLLVYSHFARIIVDFEMTWSKDNIIAILALFATCAPIFLLIVTFLLRRRRRSLKKQSQSCSRIRASPLQ
jgi:hypothetical protein